MRTILKACKTISNCRLLNVVAALWVCVVASTICEAAEQNLVSNSGFEILDTSGFAQGWDGPRDVFSIVKGDRDGSYVLHASISQKRAEELRCVQVLPLTPGSRFALNTWICPTNLMGEGGASIAVEWYKNGKKIGEYHPSGTNGTRRWFPWSLYGHADIPVGVDAVKLACTVAPGVTGDVSWDDIRLWVIPQQLLRVDSLEPNYRGWMYDGYPNNIKLRVKIDYPGHGLSPGQLHVRMALKCDKSGKIFAKSQCRIKSNDFITSLRRPTKLAAGAYTLDVALVDSTTNKTLERRSVSLVQLRTCVPAAKCWIDRHQRLIVDGKPFFPLGMYAERVPTDEDLKRISESGFNCMMPYMLSNGWTSFEAARDYLNLSEQYGVKTLFNLKDNNTDDCQGIVWTFKDHPNILAWYINDESAGVEIFPDLKRRQEIIHTVDADHPTWTVLYQTWMVNSFLDLTDAIGIDPYPVNWAPIGTAGEHAEICRKQLFGSRPIWAVPQIQNNEYHAPDQKWARPPSFEEMRNMAYQHLAEGATGLVFYCYCELKRDPDASFESRWADVSRLGRELSLLSPLLLSVDKGPKIDVQGSRVRWFSKTIEKTTSVFLVNDSRNATRAKITLPSGVSATNLDGKPISVTNTLSVSLDPIEVRVLKLTMK